MKATRIRMLTWLFHAFPFIRCNGGMSHAIPGIQVRATWSNETMLAEKLSLSASAQSKRWSWHVRRETHWCRVNLSSPKQVATKCNMHHKKVENCQIFFTICKYDVCFPSWTCPIKLLQGPSRRLHARLAHICRSRSAGMWIQRHGEIREEEWGGIRIELQLLFFFLPGWFLNPHWTWSCGQMECLDLMCLQGTIWIRRRPRPALWMPSSPTCEVYLKCWICKLSLLIPWHELNMQVLARWNHRKRPTSVLAGQLMLHHLASRMT